MKQLQTGLLHLQSYDLSWFSFCFPLRRLLHSKQFHPFFWVWIIDPGQEKVDGAVMAYSRGSAFIFSKRAKSEQNPDIYHKFSFVRQKRHWPPEMLAFSAYLQ